MLFRSPRFFVPAEQRFSNAGSRTFLIRASADHMAVAPAVRDAVSATDRTLTVSEISSFDEYLVRLTADDRSLARLAIVFGTVALILAAIGLYGVLSYGVARRSSEIAVRIALGAKPIGIIAMILRQSATMVAAGLVAGGVLTYFASQLIASRLEGVAPQDPLTVTVTIGVLLLVALAAALVPARRASRVNPMTALSRG